MTPHSNTEWRVDIEALRGVAAIAVVLFHCIGLLPVNVEHSPLAVFKIGWVGVDIFFAISGYVISRSAIRLSASPHYARNFWSLRFARIVPLYVLTSVVFLFIVSAASLRDQPWLQIVSHLTFTHNFWPSTSTSINGVTWSLALEMQLYAVAFLCAPAVARWRTPAKHAALVVAILLVLVYRYLVWKSFSATPDAANNIMHWMMQVPAMFDSFALGMWVACTNLKNSKRTWRIASLALGAALLFLLERLFAIYGENYWTTPAMAIFFRSAVALMALFLLFGALNSDGFSGANPRKIMTHVGKTSYGIYLWHLIALHLAQKLFATPGILSMFFVVVLTLIFATITFYAVEQPAMNFLRSYLRVNQKESL